MTDPAAPTVTCPHCGHSVAAGRFCSGCGQALNLHATAGGVVADALGVKRVDPVQYARTAWLAISEPAQLSARWTRGERVGLVSPIAMMGAVTLVTALLGFVLTRWTGTQQAATVIDVDELVWIAPFLKSRFPQAIGAAALDAKALNDQFQQVGGWFAAFWPSLFIAPGWLSLAPWQRIDQRGALIFAFVESVFLLILSGLYTVLKLVAPDAMATSWATGIFAFAIFYHGAEHVRGLLGGGWGYALTRPLLAALWIIPIAYLWVVFVLTVTLAVWT